MKTTILKFVWKEYRFLFYSFILGVFLYWILEGSLFR